MKVLMVGQLPTEAGGTYTNGVCNVIYELSRCATKDVEIVVYATNMQDSMSYKGNNYSYRGTKLDITSSLYHLILHPFITLQEWVFYHQKCHSFFLRYDAYRYNIERIIKEEKPDVIHCMNVCQMASCYYANRNFRIPLILTSHGVDNNPKCEFLSVMGMADIITGLTPEIIQWLCHHGVPENKIVMIPNGIDINKFYYCERERQNLRKDMGVNERTTIMLTIGSLCHRKGQLTFISKLNGIPSDFEYVYIIIGKGEDEEKIKKMIEVNNMQDRVKLLGYVNNSELYKYHSAADVYIHCSRSEGQALSEVEAYTTDLKIALNCDVKNTVITNIDNCKDYWIFDFNNFDYNSFLSWSSEHKCNRRTRRFYDWNDIFLMYSNLYKKHQNK